jgi:hypothetical protein
MCLAFFITSGLFFLGQQKVLPQPVRGSPMPFVLAFAPIALMLVWLVQVRFSRTRPSDKPSCRSSTCRRNASAARTTESREESAQVHCFRGSTAATTRPSLAGVRASARDAWLDHRNGKGAESPPQANNKSAESGKDNGTDRSRDGPDADFSL